MALSEVGKELLKSFIGAAGDVATAGISAANRPDPAAPSPAPQPAASAPSPIIGGAMAPLPMTINRAEASTNNDERQRLASSILGAGR